MSTSASSPADGLDTATTSRRPAPTATTGRCHRSAAPATAGAVRVPRPAMRPSAIWIHDAATRPETTLTKAATVDATVTSDVTSTATTRRAGTTSPSTESRPTSATSSMSATATSGKGLSSITTKRSRSTAERVAPFETTQLSAVLVRQSERPHPALRGGEDLLHDHIGAACLDHHPDPLRARDGLGRLQQHAAAGLYGHLDRRHLLRHGTTGQNGHGDGCRPIGPVDHLDRQLGYPRGTAASRAEPRVDDPGRGHEGRGGLLGAIRFRAIRQVDQHTRQQQTADRGNGEHSHRPHQDRSMRRRSHASTSTTGAAAPTSWPPRRHQGDE